MRLSHIFPLIQTQSIVKYYLFFYSIVLRDNVLGIRPTIISPFLIEVIMNKIYHL
jgi:hypothetical protein